MRFPRPKSLGSLMLIGFTLVAVPLLLAVVNGASKVRSLSEESAALVRIGVQTTHHSQQLFQQITSMERSARLYQVLADRALLDVYRDTQNRFFDTLDRLEQLPGDSTRDRYLEGLRQTQAGIDSVLLDSSVTEAVAATVGGGTGSGSTAARPAILPAVLTRFAQLSDQAVQLSGYLGGQIDSGLRDIEQRTAETQRYLAWQSLGLIVLTALLIVLFTLVLMRPIREIDRAISQLGKGTFSKPIAVRGPSDLEALGRQLEWLRVRLLDLAQERNRFLRHMSHELKTPLANIREGTELLMEGAVGELDSNQREVTSILRENGIRLQRLIENLLSFSAWQTRHTGLDISEFKLRPLIKSTLETHQLTLLSQRARLDLKVEDITLQADRAKLKLILDNLLSNAIKFTPRGGQIIIRANSNGEQLTLDVADSGPGVSPEDRERIFEAFYSGSRPQAGHVKGTGIGLSVVSEFVQAHGGTIEIVDGEHPGAHFRVRLPLAPSVELAEA